MHRKGPLITQSGHRLANRLTVAFRPVMLHLMGGDTCADVISSKLPPIRAVVWPITVRAQQPERVRRVGVLTGIGGNDTETKLRISAFLEELQRLGWVEGRNVHIDLRGGAGSAVATRKYAAELVALKPDVLLGTGSATVPALLDATRTIPIVFTILIDPVGAGYVDDLSRPGGNITGFMMFDMASVENDDELLEGDCSRGKARCGACAIPVSPLVYRFAVIQPAAHHRGLPQGLSILAMRVKLSAGLKLLLVSKMSV